MGYRISKCYMSVLDNELYICKEWYAWQYIMNVTECIYCLPIFSFFDVIKSQPRYHFASLTEFLNYKQVQFPHDDIDDKVKILFIFFVAFKSTCHIN